MKDQTQPELPDGVAVSPEDRRADVTVTLARPISHGSQELRELRIGPLRGVHVRKAPTEWASMGEVLRFAGELSALPDSVLDRLGGSDVGEVVRAVMLVSWPLLDLPSRWEEAWKLEAVRTGRPARALPDVRDGYVLELERAATVGRDTTSRLVFHELTGKVARACPLDGLPISRLPWLAGELAGVSPGVIDALEGRDLHRALALAVLFFLAVRGTGAGAASSSPSGSDGARETSTS